MKKASHSTSQLASRQVILEESAGARYLWQILFICALIVAAFLVWAAKINLDEITSASGVLVPDGRVFKVQHPLGGVIAEIEVHDGEHVDSGAVLVKLDPRLSASQWREAEERSEGAMVRRILLMALVNNTPFENLSELKDYDAVLVDEQLKLIRQQQTSFQQAIGILQNQRSQATAELGEISAQEKRTKKQKDLLEEEIRVRSGLVEKGLNSKLSFLALERQLAEYQGVLDQLVATRSKLTSRVQEVTLRQSEAASKFHEELLKEISQIDQDFVSMRGEKEREQLKVDFSELRAPVAGVVNAMSVHSSGEVIASGQKVLELIPEGAGMFAEVRIGPADIGHLKTGQLVIVKFSSYDFNRYGGITAKLDKISPATVVDEKGNPYYSGIIHLPDIQFKSKAGNLLLLPGMIVQAEIRTGSKTMMEYLLKPIYSTRNAMHER